MTTTASGSANVIASAKILTFPPRGRFAGDSPRPLRQPATAQPPAAAKIASGSAWYHDAAIQDAATDRPGKN
jgi:hypothetical protein